MAKYTYVQLIDLIGKAHDLREQAEAADQAARAAVIATFFDRISRWERDAVKRPIRISVTGVGSATITHRAAIVTLDKDRVRSYLTARQYEQCQRIGRTTFQIRYRAVRARRTA